MNIKLGNNKLVGLPPGSTVINCAGQLLVGVDVDEDGTMLASANMWDKAGERVAKLRLGAWPFNHAEYVIDTNPNHLAIRSGDDVHLEVEKTPELLWFKRLDLYSQSGERIIVRDGVAGEELGPANGDPGSVEIWSADGVRMVTADGNTWMGTKRVIDIGSDGSISFG